MSEEKVRKKIVDKCLKKTKFSPMEIEKLLDAYDSTVVICQTMLEMFDDVQKPQPLL